MKGVWGYNEDQVAPVIPDPTDFGSWVPVILGTLTINQIINMIKETEIEELSVSLNRLRLVGMSLIRALHWSETAVHQTMDPTDLNEAAKTVKKEEIYAFLLKIIYS